MKILVDANSQKVIGMHMVGPDAGEIMQVCPHIASIYILSPTCVTLQLVSNSGFVLKKLINLFSGDVTDIPAETKTLAERPMQF